MELVFFQTPHWQGPRLAGHPEAKPLKINALSLDSFPLFFTRPTFHHICFYFPSSTSSFVQSPFLFPLQNDPCFFCWLKNSSRSSLCRAQIFDSFEVAKLLPTGFRDLRSIRIAVGATQASLKLVSLHGEKYHLHLSSHNVLYETSSALPRFTAVPLPPKNTENSSGSGVGFHVSPKKVGNQQRRLSDVEPVRLDVAWLDPANATWELQRMRRRHVFCATIGDPSPSFETSWNCKQILHGFLGELGKKKQVDQEPSSRRPCDFAGGAFLATRAWDHILPSPTQAGEVPCCWWWFHHLRSLSWT